MSEANEITIRVAAAVEPLAELHGLGGALGMSPSRLSDLLRWVRLIDLSRIDDVYLAVTELAAFPLPSLSDPAALRQWVAKALDVATVVVSVTRDQRDDEAVATLRRWLADASVLDAFVDIVTRFLGGRAVSIAEASAADAPLVAQGLPPALVQWLVQFVLSMLSQWLLEQSGVHLR